MSIRTAAEATAMRKLFDYIEKDPENNLSKVGDLIDKYVPADSSLSGQLSAIKNVLGDPENNWYKLILSIWTELDPGVRRTFFENFVINATVLGREKHDAYTKEYNCNIPWVMLIDPTSACNLHCVGCWAAEYGNKLNLSLEDLNSIITQGKEMGCYFYLYSGGEPLVRKADIIRLCEMHPDCIFSAFTNATLIDEAFADEMLRVKNFVPAISAEGFEESTDSRRGEGTYKRIVRAMEILKERGLPFGVSACYTSANVYDIGSDAYFDQLIEWGAKFIWLFTYMPIGKDAVPELMVTPEQRKFMYEAVREFRNTKAIFSMDFWNDGEYSGYKNRNGERYLGGCVAAGRRYLHINAAGDVEPCAFIHYSDSNIHDKTIIEALTSPLFMGYRTAQPFNDNMLQPCPVLDNPGKLTKIVEESGAQSTDYAARETAEEYSAKCVDAAAAWAPVAEELWVASGGPEKMAKKAAK